MLPSIALALLPGVAGVWVPDLSGPSPVLAVDIPSMRPSPA